MEKKKSLYLKEREEEWKMKKKNMMMVKMGTVEGVTGRGHELAGKQETMAEQGPKEQGTALAEGAGRDKKIDGTDKHGEAG